MLIRSQDKKILVRFENLYIEPNQNQTRSGWKTIGYRIETFTNGAFGVNLGNYSTEEKAIKVLDWIEEEYLYCERCKARGEEAGTIPSYVFQMPQDSEVQP